MPQNEQHHSELSILGYLIRESRPDLASDLLTVCGPEKFMHSDTRPVAEAVRTLAERQEVIDLAGLAAVMKSMRTLSGIGGAATLAGIVQEYKDTILTETRLFEVARHLVNEHLKREARQEIAAALQAIQTPGVDVSEIAGKLRDAASNLHGEPEITEPEDPRPLQVKLSDFSGLYYLTNYPPAYEYLFKPTFVKGEVGAIVGPPSVGKGMMSLQIGTQLAAGIPIFSDLWGVEAPTRVLYLSAEDSRTTLHRRVHHAIQQLPQEVQYDAARMLHAVSVRGRVHLCQGERNSEIKLTKNLEDLRVMLEQVRPGLLFLDTLSRFLGIDENDNPAMTAACGMLEELVEEYGCNIILLHHTNKAAGDRVDKKVLDIALSQTAIRGASAFAGAVRWTLNLASLSQKCAIDILGEQAKSKAPGAFIAMQVSMSNNGVSGFRRYFGRGEQGLLYPVEAVTDEGVNADDADIKKLVDEVRRREEQQEQPLSSVAGAKNILTCGPDKAKRLVALAVQQKLLTVQAADSGNGFVLCTGVLNDEKSSSTHWMDNYDS